MLRNFIKIAARNLRLNKTYTILNITGLSLGISGAILIFIFLHYHLSFDRQHRGHEQLYRVVLDLHLDEGVEHEPGSAVPMGPMLLRDFPQVEAAGFIGKMPDATLSTQTNGETRRFLERTNVALADLGFLQIFSFEWTDNFDPAEMKQPATVVISEKAALKYFGKTGVAGQTIKLNNATELWIAGVFKTHAHPTDLDFDVLISLPTLKIIDPDYDQQQLSWISSRNFTFVRLAKGSDPTQLERLLFRNGAKYYGDLARYYKHRLQPLADMHFDQNYDGKIRKSILWILGGVGAFLMLIACINFINLATAQALKRSKEIGVRKVLGSTQRQVFWQFMSETAVITGAASVSALLLTGILVPFMNNLTQTKAYSFAGILQPELVIFWILSMVLIVLLAGFYPSVVISGFNPITALKGKTGNRQAGGLNLRRSLVTVQLVIAQVLVTGTLVLLMQLKFFKNADLGFDQHAVVTISLPKLDATRKVSQSLKNDLLQHIEVQSVTYQYEAPTSSMGYGGSFRFDNRAEWEKFMIRDRFADEHYLKTYKMPLLAGRSFMVKDSAVEFVVNEELMHRLGIRDPEKMLGKQMEDGNTGFKGEIVGVVKSFHLKSLQEAVEPCAIFANPGLYKEVAIKLDTKDLPATLQKVRNAWSKTYPDEVFEFQFVDEKIARFYEKEQLLTTLIQSFAAIAIFICCLGLYGMVSFMVSQRTKEIGVRKVLGAGVKSIVMLFGKEFLALTFVATLVAAPVAWYLMSTWLGNFAYRINLNWWIPATGGLIILAMTLITVGYKVIAAALLNPVKSLKMD